MVQVLTIIFALVSYLVFSAQVQRLISYCVCVVQLFRIFLRIYTFNLLGFKETAKIEMCLNKGEQACVNRLLDVTSECCHDSRK